ncbi:MAG: GYD domain-containing protein [bacterium]
MKTYVLMSKMTPQGPSIVEVASNIKSGPKARHIWLEAVKMQCPDVKFLGHYALLGSWDFMDIYEATDSDVAAKVSILCSTCTSYQVESWTAIPCERLQALAADIRAACE